jgi:hypothetical protein
MQLRPECVDNSRSSTCLCSADPSRCGSSPYGVDTCRCSTCDCGADTCKCSSGPYCVNTCRCSTCLCSSETFRCSSGPCGVDTFKSSTCLCSADTSGCSSGRYGVEPPGTAQASVVQTRPDAVVYRVAAVNPELKKKIINLTAQQKIIQFYSTKNKFA